MMSHRQTIAPTLTQTLSPRQIRALRLLRMPTLDLVQEIQQELMENPLLEVSESDTEDRAQEEQESEPGEELQEADFEDSDLDSAEYDEDEWRALLNDSGYPGTSEEYDPGREIRDIVLAKQVSMEDSLREQLLLSDLDGSEREIAEYLIGCLHADGYLSQPLEDIAETLDISFQAAERVLAAIQMCEPSGIGARDLRECLMIQLRRNGLESSVAMAVVRDHLDNLIDHRYERMMRDLGVKKPELADALEAISILDPKPGFLPEPTLNCNLITPDLEVNKVGDDYVVTLTSGREPSLQISPVYRKLLNQSRSGKKEERKYILERLRSARWFLEAIHDRRTTMLRVMRCIVEHQRGFFDHGVSHLCPMVMQEVADKTDRSVSTISRVCNGKYVQTPHGVFELRYFFGGGLSTEDGEDVSARTVKEMIRAVIREEDSQKPLSDQKIADLLHDRGIDIARRTVTKYREQMKINSARHRKSL